MQSSFVVWRFVLLLGLLTFPQLLGVLLYFRLSRFSRWLARFLAFLCPALVFIYLSPIFFFGRVSEAQVNGEAACGTSMIGFVFLIYVGTVVQLLTALVIQVILFRRHSFR